jgi:hypothetical protein
MTTRDPFTVAFVVTLLLGAVVFQSFRLASAYASVGAQCSHTTQCDGDEVMHTRQYCLADSPSSSTGHCVRLHILP